jgi:hypothetical protein
VFEQIQIAARRWRNVLAVHDEGVFVVENRFAKRCLEEVLEAFHTPPFWAPDLPVSGEGVICDAYVKP